MTVASRLARLVRSVRSPRPAAPSPGAATVSVIVPFLDVAAYLDEALDSLLAQTYRDLEVWLVDDGSTDESLAIARRRAARDARVHVLTQEHAGQGAARNLALERASGGYVTFLDADDVLPRHAYATMVATLEETGSDFCLGAVERFDAERSWVPAWAREVHARPVRGTTIDAFPAAIKDIIACNRMYRRSSWDERVGRFPEGMAYEDHVPMLRSFLGGARFDVLTTTTYRWRQRPDGTSTGQQKWRQRNLLDRIRAKAEAWQVLADEASEQTQQAWLGRVLDVDLPPFAELAPGADDAYREALRGAYSTYLSLIGPTGLRHVRAAKKASAHLVVAGRWNELAALQQAARVPGTLLGRVEDGRALLPGELLDPILGAPGLVPADLRELSAHESRLAARAQRVSWGPDGSLAIAGAVRFHGIDVAAADATMLVQLPGVSAVHAELEAAPATTGVRPPLAFRVRVPDATTLRPGAITVVARARGLVREGPLLASPGGSAGHRTARTLGAEATVALVPTPDGIVVEAAPAPVAVGQVSLDASRLEVEVAAGSPSRLALARGTERLAPAVGARSARFDLPSPARPGEPWQLVIDPDGPCLPVVVGPDALAALPGPRVWTTPDGVLQVDLARTGAELVTGEALDGALRLILRTGPGEPDGPWHVAATKGGDLGAGLTATAADDGQVALTVPAELWNPGSVVRRRVVTPSGAEVTVPADVLESLPRTIDERDRSLVLRAQDGLLRLELRDAAGS